jgi:beta-galactosidase GanA
MKHLVGSLLLIVFAANCPAQTSFDRAIAALAKHNLKIIFGTPTATPPKWLTQKYPEVLYVFADRQPANDQTRRQYNYNSPVYRRLSKRIVTELASHYKDNPHIIGWQLDNDSITKTRRPGANFDEWIPRSGGVQRPLSRRF